MALLTFQIIEGLEAGRVFQGIKTPLTIGREEDNDIQLNDERVSRFHLKVQEESGRLILTDLDSTNGTRVNGHPVRLRVLQPGDLISVGRTLILNGGPEELKKLTERLREASKEDPDKSKITTSGSGRDQQLDISEIGSAFPHGVPPVPSQLSITQTAELVDLLEYVRIEILNSVSAPTEDLRTGDGQFLRIDPAAWLKLKALTPELSRIITSLINPQS